MITFTPLSGSAHSDNAALAYVLQIDDVTILLDCGAPDWNPEDISLDWESYCSALRTVAPSIDLVLLSHGDLAHCGLYAYAFSRWGLKAATYTTLPVQAMGRIATTEDIEGIREQEDVADEFEAAQDDDPLSMMPGLEPSNQPKAKDKVKGKYVASFLEVHDAFDSINTLRYSQPTHLQGRCQGITITPFNAGHTIGGTIWKIRSPSSGTIIYAVDINHMKERHLDGTVLVRPSPGGIFEPLARPDLLITDAYRAATISSRRRDRDAAFLDAVTATLSSRQSILLPCDASTRVLEILVLLDQHWSYSKLKYPICFLTRTGSEMLTFVRSMMEWLGGTISKDDVGEDGSGHRHNKRKRDDEGDDEALGAFALRFKHLEIFSNPQALLQTYSSKDPKLILAVPASLSHGSSRQLFTDFASIPDNVILLTSRGPEGTLSRVLFERWNDAQRPETKWDKGKIGSNVMLDGTMKIHMNYKVPLQGVELEAYLEKQRIEREKEAAHQAALVRNQRMLEADEDSDSESDSDDDEEEVRQALGDEMDVDGTVRNKNADTLDWAGMDADDGYKQLLSFDIFVKGNVSKGTSFFKSVGKASHRFRMFPYVEKKRRVDQYGETIDVGMWLRKSKFFEEEAESDETKYSRLKQAEEEAKKVAQEVPSKFTTSDIDQHLACRLLYIDMEGLNDGRAVKTIVPQINPRKMIIVHATPESTRTLIESCATIHAMTKDIFSPMVGENIQIGQQTSSYSISISDDLLATVRMSKFEDNEVGFLRGRVTAHASSTIPVLEPSFLPSTDVIASLPAPRILGSRRPKPLPSSTMIGELKLTVLKSRLAAVGITAELVGEGVLICGAGARPRGEEGDTKESVAVRKFGRGQIELEGNVSDVYYTVRKEIYNLHALTTCS